MAEKRWRRSGCVLKLMLTSCMSMKRMDTRFPLPCADSVGRFPIPRRWRGSAPAAPLGIATLGCLLWGASSAGAGVVLVEKGQPRATIVVATDASDQAREAARLLQDYVARLSWARLEICAESAAASGAQVLVGRTRRGSELGVDLPPRFTNAMNEEEYVLKTAGNALIVAGNEHPF